MATSRDDGIRLQDVTEEFGCDHRTAQRMMRAFETVFPQVSVAYRAVEEIRGRADAVAAGVYANAYNVSPESSEFYVFTRTMQAYQDMISGETTLILNTDGDVFRYFEGMGSIPSDQSDQISPIESE